MTLYMFTVIHTLAWCKCDKFHLYYSTLEVITALNGALPEDMIIDGSLVNVSTVIGQGIGNILY